MNFRVDLIQDTERRSASVISAKFLIRLAAILVPVIIVLSMTGLVLGMLKIQAVRDDMEQQWVDQEPKQKAAQALHAEVASNQQVLDEIEGWKKASLMWRDQLVELQKLVPKTIQLNDLRMTGRIEGYSENPREPNKPPHRFYALRFNGIMFGDINIDNAENNDVKKMVEDIQASPVFSNVVKSAKVDRFDRPEAAAGGSQPLNYLVFEISCDYKPRKF